MSVIDAYLVRWRGALGGARIEDYRAQTIVEGAHVSSLDDLTFDEARFKLRGLRDWLGAWWYGPPAFPPPDPRWIPEASSRRRCRRRRSARLRDARRLRVNDARWRRYEVQRRNATRGPLLIEAEVAGVRLRLDLVERQARSHYEQSTTQHGVGWAEPLEPMSVRELQERVLAPLVNLLVLLADEQSHVEELTLTIHESAPDFVLPAMRPGRKTLPRSISIFESAWPRLRRPDANLERPLLPRRALGSGAPRVVERWYALIEELRPADLIAFGVWNAESIYLENMLLNLMSFAEAFHERRMDQPRLDRAEHVKLVKKLVRGLPEELRQAYREALAYAYRQTQRERVTELVESACVWVPAIAPNPETLVQQLVATRNHLTHLGDAGPDVVDDDELVDVVQRLSAVLRISLLLALDIDGDAVEYAFRARYRGSPLLSTGHDADEA
jgi:hypothetical protein